VCGKGGVRGGDLAVARMGRRPGTSGAWPHLFFFSGGRGVGCGCSTKREGACKHKTSAKGASW